MEPTTLEQQIISEPVHKMAPFSDAIYKQKYAWKDENGIPVEEWPDTALRVTENVLGALGYEDTSEEFQKVLGFITERKFMPGGRYLYAAGRPLHQTQNCFMVRVEDTREGWSDLLKKAAMVLQTGGGLGVEYSKVRAAGLPISRTGGTASGPLPLMQMVNEIGRGVMQGGSRRSALIALLDWDHPDVFQFIHMKDWPEEIKQLKEKDFNFPATMDMTNISINLDDEFFIAYEDDSHPKHETARDVYSEAVANMLATGEPGFSINTGENAGEDLRNPCSEAVSRDDSDVCNLGSINIAAIDSKEEFEDVVRHSILFLLAGSVYSDVPYDKVEEVRDENRRIGLGLMGLHEWLIKEGLPYGPNEELSEWLDIYSDVSDEAAAFWARRHALSVPIATRAIAPTGTIAILAETTTGIEPILSVAYKRRYLAEGTNWKYQYVVDPTAKRLVAEGADPNDIEDAYMLSYNVERRVAFQAWLQSWVDQAISSTINIPYQVTDADEATDFADMLYGYLPNLRGITVYPDGSRGGQPIVPVPYEQAIGQEGVVFEEHDDRCKSGACGA